jgi:hypothetical protein
MSWLLVREDGHSIHLTCDASAYEQAFRRAYRGAAQAAAVLRRASKDARRQKVVKRRRQQALRHRDQRATRSRRRAPR